MRLNFKQFFMYFSASLLVMLLLFGWAFSNILACMQIEHSSFKLIAPQVYLSPQMPKSLQKPIEKQLEEAKKRLKSFWGDLQSQPTLIFCASLQEFETYATHLPTPALVHYTPWQCYIVISIDGANVNVLSHEISHAELWQRLGWYNKFTKIPAWFDEGLALLVDYRYPDSSQRGFEAYDKKWNQLTQQGKYGIELKNLVKSKDFYKEDCFYTYLAYLTAGREVSRWYEKVGKKGLFALIEQLKTDKSFENVYHQVVTD